VPGVYSKRFLALSSQAGYGAYTVPPGYVAVVKWVAINNHGTAAANATLEQLGTTIWSASVPGNNGQVMQHLFLVYASGELMRMWLAQATMSGTATGYLLAES
jgi:hypothetical protein